MLALDLLLFGVVLALGARAALLVGLAVRHRLRGRRPPAEGTPLVSVVVPAHDEEAVIEGTLRALAASDWPALELVVVDDGSTDSTLARVRALALARPLVVLTHAPNRGKAAALQRGIAASRGSLVVTVDADTLVEPDAIGHLARAFDGPAVGAVAGHVRVGAPEPWLGAWQSLEYVGCLNVERRALAALGCVTTVPGALGAFRRSALEASGGLSAETLAEDTDLTLALLRAGWAVRYEDRARAATAAPATLRSLYRQRLRWLHGNLQCAWKHRRALRAGPRALRLAGLPNLWFTHLFVFLLLPLTPLFVARARALLSPGGAAAAGAALFALDLAVVALAYALDGRGARLRELAHAPLQRLAWPALSWVVFAGVLVRLARGDAAWTRAARPALAPDDAAASGGRG